MFIAVKVEGVPALINCDHVQAMTLQDGELDVTLTSDWRLSFEDGEKKLRAIKNALRVGIPLCEIGEEK